MAGLKLLGSCAGGSCIQVFLYDPSGICRWLLLSVTSHWGHCEMTPEKVLQSRQAKPGLRGQTWLRCEELQCCWEVRREQVSKRGLQVLNSKRIQYWLNQWQTSAADQQGTGNQFRLDLSPQTPVRIRMIARRSTRGSGALSPPSHEDTRTFPGT